MPKLGERKLTERQLVTAPLHTMTAEQAGIARLNGAPFPFLFNAACGGGITSTSGALTTPYAGASGKWYVDSTGTYQLAAAATPYLHHEYDSALSLWTPRGLLWETGRVNKLTNSFDLSHADWSPTGLASKNTTATKAGVTMYKLVEDTSAGAAHGVAETFTLAGTTCAMKYIVAAAERSWIRVGVVAAATKIAYVNLATGAIGTVSSGCTCTAFKRADSSWEINFYATGLTAGAGALALVRLAPADNTGVYDGVANQGLWCGPVILVDGASEVGSLIPSAGTRTADVPSISSAWMNAGFLSRGRITVKWTPNAASSSATRTLFDCRSAANVGFTFEISAINKYSSWWSGATKAQSNAVTLVAGQTYTDVIEWAWTGAAYTITIYHDGTQIGTSVNGAALGTLGNCFLGQSLSNTVQADGVISEIYAEAL